jgi:signal transduction histidine kinase
MINLILCNMFKKFYELDTTLRRDSKPYEIRLVLCKGIIEELGGKIWVESEEGKGSNFQFILPLEVEI